MLNDLFSYFRDGIAKIFPTTGKTDPLTFDLTYEEKREVDKAFNLFKEHAVHSSVADKFKQGLMAWGLANYATDVMHLPSQSDNREDSLDKAIRALSKAYSIYPLPIYLYDMACCCEMKNMRKEAKGMFKVFLVRQHEYKSDQIDDAFLGGRDIEIAKNRASESLRER